MLKQMRKQGERLVEIVWFCGRVLSSTCQVYVARFIFLSSIPASFCERSFLVIQFYEDKLVCDKKKKVSNCEGEK